MIKHIFSFNGRIQRTEYGVTAIFYWVVYLILKYAIAGDSHLVILGLLYFPLIWFYWAQGARRCHDLGKSGWWQIIPFYGLWMVFQKGQPFANEYDIGGRIREYGAEDYERPVEDYADSRLSPIIDTNSSAEGALNEKP